jgi:hypothetical protein
MAVADSSKCPVVWCVKLLLFLTKCAFLTVWYWLLSTELPISPYSCFYVMQTWTITRKNGQISWRFGLWLCNTAVCEQFLTFWRHSDLCNTWELLAQRQCHMLYLWKQHYGNLKSNNKSHFPVCNYQTNWDICHTAVCQLFRWRGSAFISLSNASFIM